MKREVKENEEIARIIERDQIISYKKKSNKPQKESDDEIQSANSLKSGVFSEDSEAKMSKKNTPLPELYRDKKRVFHKNFVVGEVKQVNNYLEKEVRQHDNLVLKQKNNLLTTQNMKLKTKVMALEKEISKISKSTDEQVQKPKQPGLLPKDNKFKGSQILSLKMTLKNLRKELDQQKKENEKIKFSVKFTRINELQIERQQILNQTTRLRQLLEQEQVRKLTQKTKQQGLTAVQQKLQSITDKNIALSKQNVELVRKLKNYEEGNKKIKQISQNEKNLNKMLFNAKRLIKEKEKQIQTLKIQNSSTQPKIESVASINDTKSSKDVGKAYDAHRSSKQKRIMSKSAQKYRKKGSQEALEASQCSNCQKNKQKIVLLQQKIQELTLKLKIQKQQNSKLGSMGEFSREQIQLPTAEQINKLGRFLVFRFKAHHLTLEQAQKYLINGELTQVTKKQSVTVMEIAESLIAEPFSILSSRYLQNCLVRLFYASDSEKGYKNGKVKIDENKKLTKGQVLSNFIKFIQAYQIMSQQKEEQMFIQIAQLVTNYHQHILTALNRKRNGQGTISEQELTSFFNEIELQKQFVDFIICQIILESLDLQHLNYYTMFEIFYMPTQAQQAGPAEPNQPNKKKFQVDHSQVVKQQDEQYEQSKSHIDTKQKTQSKKQDLEQYEQDEYQHSPSQHSEKQKGHDEDSTDNLKTEARQKRNKSLKNVEARLEKEKMKEKQKPKQSASQQEEDDYEQLFQEQKMEHLPEEQKAQEGKDNQDDLKPYTMQEVYDEYNEDGN